MAAMTTNTNLEEGALGDASGCLFCFLCCPRLSHSATYYSGLHVAIFLLSQQWFTMGTLWLYTVLTRMLVCVENIVRVILYRVVG